MIDFALTDEQRLLEQSVREWGAREIAPRIHALDREHRFDPNILAQMASLGLLGICVPPEYGGAGMDYISLGLACEELEYVDTSLRVIMSVHVGLNSLSLLAWGRRTSARDTSCRRRVGRRSAALGSPRRVPEATCGGSIRSRSRQVTGGC